ncbi:MAG: thiosulfate oxidation carrier complex protein SoxZ [Thiotrichales bacterium]|jgi:sulfur-oxidizing protein SoxZ|nr:thiosulfate oxidation carrier complex protein SoxZ [Thiotrichales bacterium]MBT3752930.1 thiosulfate oxidation carrier complex protein SoxZ [Thiotrichales bacterium]MBT3837574.1 thiosulfate oxidation carrier complex protein SoxZ [Thiotrichales bacterium]MBT4151964.1 thiosulfate oxidation carrier complex protein SoxZ [Thiotrichales bacterium]MBT4262184.1 thiosulfate oxidation carrier complex protein SoxZ [Thiotrichales bacterium]
MTKSVRIKAKEKKGVIDIKCLLSHPMETGLRKDKKSGKTIPAHFIQTIVAEIDGAVFMHADINVTISKNPYLRMRVDGKKGDNITVTWTDNTGAVGTTTTPSK